MDKIWLAAIQNNKMNYILHAHTQASDSEINLLWEICKSITNRATLQSAQIQYCAFFSSQQWPLPLLNWQNSCYGISYFSSFTSFQTKVQNIALTRNQNQIVIIDNNKKCKWVSECTHCNDGLMLIWLNTWQWMGWGGGGGRGPTHKKYNKQT